MIASFLITFRETLEAALIVGIVLGYLIKIKQTKYNNIVYIAIGGAIIASMIGALIFNFIAGGFEGRGAEIFEGIVVLIGAMLLTTMILWMLKQNKIEQNLKEHLNEEISQAHKYGIFSVVFISVLREGIETVVFLEAASYVTSDNNIVGALLGIIVAIILGYLLYVLSIKINVKKFLNISSFLLILFAAGMVAYGIHELQKAQIIPIIIGHVWDINPQVYADGSYPLLHEKGTIGEIFKGLFGYNGNPSLIEVISYVTYLIVVGSTWIVLKKNKKAHPLQ